MPKTAQCKGYKLVWNLTRRKCPKGRSYHEIDKRRKILLQVTDTPACSKMFSFDLFPPLTQIYVLCVVDIMVRVHYRWDQSGQYDPNWTICHAIKDVNEHVPVRLSACLPRSSNHMGCCPNPFPTCDVKY